MREEDTEMQESLNLLSYKILGLAIEVRKQLGPGLLESAYQECLFYMKLKMPDCLLKVKNLYLFLTKK